MNIQFFSSDKQKILDEKNIIRINKEIDRTDSLMTVTMQEFQKVQAINNAVKDTLMSEEEKASAMEEALRVSEMQKMILWGQILIFT